MSRNVRNANDCPQQSGGTVMAGLEIPTWDPQTAMLIGSILLEAVLLYVGYAGLERVVGPRLMKLLVGGARDAQ
ncbi:hypothetical protein [Halorubrum sp. PV6]|uniref:DUF7512 family protein n=2 Tax=Halorubrum TaxID=56688 RepID=UPI0014450DF6|nr:hypothetical protein [Halorubrum sp. PV6]